MSNYNNAMDIFANNIFPAIVFAIGMIGDTLGIIVLSRKGLSNMKLINAYRFLLISDLIYFFTQTPITNIMYSYPRIDLTSKFSWFCKLFVFSNCALYAPSPFTIIYFSVERLVAARFPSKRFFLKKDKIFFTYITIILLLSFVYFSPILYYYDLIENPAIIDNTTNETIVTYSCNDANTVGIEVVYWLYLILSSIPYPLLAICTILLVVTIFQSRIKNKLNSKKLKKDLKVAINLISLNLIFIILTLPIGLSNSANMTTAYEIDIYLIEYMLYSISYGINFYLLVATNSIIRNEFFLFMGLKKSHGESKLLFAYLSSILIYL